MKSNAFASHRVVAQAIREFAKGPQGVELQRFAYGLCGRVTEAQELVQETYYRALKSGRYSWPRPLGVWLKTILRYAFLDARKRFDRRVLSLSGGSVFGDGVLCDDVVDSSLSSLEVLEQAETRREVGFAVEALSGEHRAVVELCDMQGRPYEEAARMLGIPEGTLRSRLARARVRLRVMLARCGR